MIKLKRRISTNWKQKLQKINVQSGFSYSNGNDKRSKISVPFSVKLREDKSLQLSDCNFKEIIVKHLDSNNRSISQMLDSTAKYPTAFEFAKFAKNSYLEKLDECGDNLPNGWKVLTTAKSNNKLGYHGVAFWHPAHQQVIVAHRGTVKSLPGSWLVNLLSVYFGKFSDHLSSASTFANKICRVLNELNKKKNTDFQIFFTGHSLGGFLAQVTTFTTEYLELQGMYFLKSNHRAFHSHTVVFDCPGCREMLHAMQNEFEFRCTTCTMSIDDLDITEYLCMPNYVNTFNTHMREIYYIHNVKEHNINAIVEALRPSEGHPGESKLKKALDWPNSGILTSKELANFIELYDSSRTVGSILQFLIFGFTNYNKMRFLYEECIENQINVRVFTKYQQRVLKLYQMSRYLRKPTKLFTNTLSCNEEDILEKKLSNFKINSEKFECESAEELKYSIPYIKRLLKFNPVIKIKTEEQFLEKLKLKIFADDRLKTLIQSFVNANTIKKENTFTTIDLSRRIPGEILQDNVKTCGKNENIQLPVKQENIDLLNFYDQIIELYYILLEIEKVKMQNTNFRIEYSKEFKKDFQRDMQSIAVGLFYMEGTKLVNKYNDPIDPDQWLLSGLLEKRNDGIQFISRTLMEYFAAKFLANEIFNKRNNLNLPTFTYKILVHPDYFMIRSFLNSNLIFRFGNKYINNYSRAPLIAPNINEFLIDMMCRYRHSECAPLCLSIAENEKHYAIDHIIQSSVQMWKYII